MPRGATDPRHGGGKLWAHRFMLPLRTRHSAGVSWGARTEQRFLDLHGTGEDRNPQQLKCHFDKGQSRAEHPPKG